jgi:hypothetical protein
MDALSSLAHRRGKLAKHWLHKAHDELPEKSLWIARTITRNAIEAEVWTALESDVLPRRLRWKM